MFTIYCMGAKKITCLGRNSLFFGRNQAGFLYTKGKKLVLKVFPIGPRRGILQSNLGVIRLVNGDRVLATLFTPKGKLEAEFLRAQFPKGEIKPNSVFRQRIEKVGPGRICYTIDMMEMKEALSNSAMQRLSGKFRSNLGNIDLYKISS